MFQLQKRSALHFAFLILGFLATAYGHRDLDPISIKNITTDGVDVFYREAGSISKPTILLLHGFPSSSHQFRYLMPLLAQDYHVIAPDLPGFGFTVVPKERNYKYTFDSFAITTEKFLDALKIKKFSIYIFDYGAPVGLRIALKKPSAVTAIISQNGNAYLEGLGTFWAPAQKYWLSGSQADREALGSQLLTFNTTKLQYTHGSQHPESLAPESWYLDYALFTRPGNSDIQLDIFYDYRSNLPLYQQFQAYFRRTQIPLIAIWGRHDFIFVPPGAEAFKRDLPKAEIHLIDAGHFASVSDSRLVASLAVSFLKKYRIH